MLYCKSSELNRANDKNSTTFIFYIVQTGCVRSTAKGGKTKTTCNYTITFKSVINLCL